MLYVSYFIFILKGALASDGALKKQIRRTRREIHAAPDTPKDLMTLIILNQYKCYSPSEGITEQFLLYDNGPGIDRILIFGRTRSLEMLCESSSRYFQSRSLSFLSSLCFISQNI